MKISQLKADALTDSQRTALLFHHVEDDHLPGDCIFVPGSSKAVVYRVPKAVQLYKAGRANKILFSGGVVWQGGNLTEAEQMANKALKRGVSQEAILVENESLHTKENVLASMFVLDRAYDLHNLQEADHCNRNHSCATNAFSAANVYAKLDQVFIMYGR